MDLTPALVMAMWTAGIAGAGSLVAYWAIVGPGFTWLVGGTVAGFGLFAVLVEAGVVGWVGVVAGAASIVLARRPRFAAGALGVAALSFLVVAFDASPWLLATTGALMIGGITSEMLLGHWYLVDPKLPRWALTVLVAGGAAGLVADTVLIGIQVIRNGVQSDVVFAWAYIPLVAMTALLLVGVWFSLKEPRYTGVMAATGLSYLAVLTGLGVLVVGRIIGFEV